jgi:hypothetical protein
MVRIEVLMLFRSGHNTFHPGEIRLVEESEARHFCAAGWARSAEFGVGAVDIEPKRLQVHNSTVGQSAPILGVK